MSKLELVISIVSIIKNDTKTFTKCYNLKCPRELKVDKFISKLNNILTFQNNRKMNLITTVNINILCKYKNKNKFTFCCTSCDTTDMFRYVFTDYFVCRKFLSSNPFEYFENFFEKYQVTIE